MCQETIQVYPRPYQKNLNALRRQGIIPGIMYGQSLKESLPIQINVRDLQAIINQTAHATTFFVEYEGKVHECILRDYQTDRLHTSFLHVDLQYIKDNEIIKMNIPVEYEGTEFLSHKKLILEKALSKVPVKGPIENLPKAFTFNLADLGHGSKITASEIVLPPDTELLIKDGTIIATLQ